MSLSITVDRYDYCAGTYAFCAEHHAGQSSDLYARLCRIGQWFKPGAGWSDRWEDLSEAAQDVYRAWCKREDVLCDYDTVPYLLVNNHGADDNDDCTEWFLDWCSGETLEESGLVNFDRSDFVNIAMPYTKDLIRFYDMYEESLLGWFDQWQECMCLGGCRMDALAQVDTTVDDPDDFKTAIVNTAMSYLGGLMLSQLEEA